MEKEKKEETASENDKKVCSTKGQQGQKCQTPEQKQGKNSEALKNKKVQPKVAHKPADYVVDPEDENKVEDEGSDKFGSTGI